METQINYIPEIQIKMTPAEAYAYWNALGVMQKQAGKFLASEIEQALKNLRLGLADGIDAAKVFDKLPRQED